MSVNFESNFKKLNIPGQNNNSNDNIELNFDSFNRSNDINPIENLLPSENGDSVQGDFNLNMDNNSVSNSSHSFKENRPEMDYDQMQNKKAFYLTEIERFRSLGCPVYKNYDMSYDFQEISGAYFQIKKTYEMKNGLALYRNIMITSMHMLETADNKFNVIGDLDGVSLHFNSNINSFDDIFVELHEKYGGLKGPPEFRLLITTGMLLASYKASRFASRTMYNFQADTIKNTVNSGNNKATMSGPSEKILSQMKNLDINSDNESVSDISSIKSDISLSSFNKNLQNMSFNQISINQEAPTKKKRGRKPKNTN